MPTLRATLLGALLGALGCDPDAAPDHAPWPPVVRDRERLDVKRAFDEGRVTILAQDAVWPLGTWPAASLDKGEALGVLAADQDATVLHARAESAFEIRTEPLGPGARLLARTFVFPVDRRDPAKADPFPTTFRVLVDGRERATVDSSYVRDTEREHPFDKLMRTLEIDLSEREGESVLLRFETTREGRPAPGPDDPSAEPAWWQLSLVTREQVPRRPADSRRPNVLVLCVDTLSAARLSLQGYGRPTTPRLEAFAARGTRFAQATSPSSWTLPSTASLLTGLAPNTHGVLGDVRSYLMDALDTWPERLRAAGMEGAAFVGNPLVARANHFDQGFSTWVNDDGRSVHDPVDAEELVDRLIAWLDEQPRGAGWFAYLHPMDPHAPYGAPGAGRDRFTEPGYVERRDFGGHLPRRLQEGEDAPLDVREQRHVIDLYDGEVAYLDAQFGRLVDALQERGLLDDTIVAVTADHGEELFELGRLGHGYDLSEPMLHVPLVLVGPGVPAGTVEQPVSTMGLANTLLRLAVGDDALLPDAEPPLPLGEDPTPGRRVYSLTRTHLFGERRLLVSGRDDRGRKVVLELPATAADDGALPEPTDQRFFDLTSEAGESAPVDPDDLTPREREEYHALAARALAWYAATAAARPGDVQPRVSVQDALRTLGYVGSSDEDR